LARAPAILTEVFVVFFSPSSQSQIQIQIYKFFPERSLFMRRNCSQAQIFEVIRVLRGIVMSYEQFQTSIINSVASRDIFLEACNFSRIASNS
jgi:hypothetical protein